MKYNIIGTLSLIAFTTGFPRRGRIYGGQNAASSQFPYIVSLNDYNQYCDGVIIAPNWILTAAQCLFYLSSEARIYVGSNINEANGTVYRISDTIRIPHEDWDEYTYRNDIGLIKLNTDLVLSDTVKAIEFTEGVAPNTSCTVAGWGSTQDEIFPAELKYIGVTAIDTDFCKNILAEWVYDFLGPGQICTLAPEGQGICVGDAGGPLVCDGKLAGIVSYNVGYPCGIEMPDVHTSITAYLNWILTTIQP